MIIRTLPLALLGACIPYPDDDTDVPATDGCVDVAFVSWPSVARADPVEVKLVATHDEGLPVSRVEVDGVPAVIGTDGLWVAKLRLDPLVEAAVDGQATISATAEDVYGCTGESELTLTVDSTPDAVVDTLTLTTTVVTALEPAPSYVPTSGAVLVQLEVAADAAAAGTSVKVSAENGSVVGSQDLLLSEGASAAHGVALIRPGTAQGHLHATVVGGNVAATATLRVISGPSVTSASGEIAPGEVDAFTVWTLGELDHCEAYVDGSGAVSATVSAEGAAAQPLVVSGVASGRAAFARDTEAAVVTVSAPPDVDDELAIRVECADVYGQAVSRITTIRPPDDTDTDGSWSSTAG